MNSFTWGIHYSTHGGPQKVAQPCKEGNSPIVKGHEVFGYRQTGLYCSGAESQNGNSGLEPLNLVRQHCRNRRQGIGAVAGAMTSSFEIRRGLFLT